MTFEIRQTPKFKAWFENLPDQRIIEIIARRIVRLETGLFGDAKSVGSGVSELRIDFGPGYRIYFTRRKNIVVILLCGGAKSTQSRVIDLAKKLAAGLEDENGQN